VILAALLALFHRDTRAQILTGSVRGESVCYHVLAVGLYADIPAIARALNATILLFPLHNACRHIRLGMSYQIPSVPCLLANCRAKQLGSWSAIVFNQPAGSFTRCSSNLRMARSSLALEKQSAVKGALSSGPTALQRRTKSGRFGGLPFQLNISRFIPVLI